MDAPPRNRKVWSDAELLSAMAERDAAAFAVSYRRHVAMTLASLLRQTRDRVLAADLAAEVFAATLLCASRYRPQRESAVPWVIAIAHNKLLGLRHGQVEARARHRLGFQPVTVEDDGVGRMERITRAGGGQLAQLLEDVPRNGHVTDAEPGRLACSELVVRKRGNRARAPIRAHGPA